MNGGNILDGQSEASGSVTDVPENKKWRQRYEVQKEQNNLLSDRLRATRAYVTRIIGTTRKHLDEAKAAVVAQHNTIMMLQGLLKSNGIEVKLDEGKESTDDS